VADINLEVQFDWDLISRVEITSLYSTNKRVLFADTKDHFEEAVDHVKCTKERSLLEKLLNRL